MTPLKLISTNSCTEAAPFAGREDKTMEVVQWIAVPEGLGSDSVMEVMKGSARAGDLRSLLRTSDQVARFVRSLDRYLTPVLRGADSQCLLREAIETGCHMYLAGGTYPVNHDRAQFVAGALAVAARGLLAYEVVGIRGRVEVVWQPLNDGPFARFVASNSLTRVGFRPKVLAGQASQVAMRSCVLTHVCEFDDLVMMEASGVDFRKIGY